MEETLGTPEELPLEAHDAPADRLAIAIASLPPEGVTLAQIRDLFGSDGLMLLTAFLTIVFLVPVSIPGVSTVFGAGILLIAISRTLGRELWLPRFLADRAVGSDRLRVALQRGLVWFRRLEHLSRPHRMPAISSRGLAGAFNNGALIVAALLLMAPFGLIPFSNTLPAVALLLLAIGLMQRDGVCILLGHLAVLATFAYFTVLMTGGALALYEAADRLSR